MVVSLTVTGDRVFAGDQMESCHCFKYRRAENQLVEFADDQVGSPVSCSPFRNPVQATVVHHKGRSWAGELYIALRFCEEHFLSMIPVTTV